MQQDILRKLANICALSQGLRMGQMLEHLGFLAEDMFDRNLRDIEDDQLLEVVRRHEAELSQRQSNVA